MLNNLRIENFKSIKNLEAETKRVNIFVGEPNTGKSNILEALGFLSFCEHAKYSGNLKSYIRYNRISNLFYDESIDHPIKIGLDDLRFTFNFTEQGTFRGRLHNGKTPVIDINTNYDVVFNFKPSSSSSEIPRINYYKFAFLEKFTRNESEYLLPPDGPNLLSILLTNSKIKSAVNNIFTHNKLRLVLKPQDNSIEVIKDLGDILVAYPYLLISDTIQRVIFHLCAILSNKNSTLIFEEPESHAFPYYTKQLAEIMALDKANNRYFIATHNPYFLQPIIEKTPKADLAIFITYFEDYQTKLKPLSPEQIEEIMEVDIFSNLQRYLEIK